MADPEYKYGNFDFVNERVGIELEEDTETPEGETSPPPVNASLITGALLSADAFIDMEIEKASLPLPSSPYSTTLTQGASYYALFDCMMGLFSNDEEKNNKASDYLLQAHDFINGYIEIEIKRLSNNANYNEDDTNAYSVSKSHIDTRFDIDQIIR